MSKFSLGGLGRNVEVVDDVDDLRSYTLKLDDLRLLESRWYTCSAENIEAQRVSFAALADPGWYGGCHGHDVLRAIHSISPGRCGKVLIDVGANKGVGSSGSWLHSDSEGEFIYTHPQQSHSFLSPNGWNFGLQNSASRSPSSATIGKHVASITRAAPVMTAPLSPQELNRHMQGA